MNQSASWHMPSTIRPRFLQNTVEIKGCIRSPHFVHMGLQDYILAMIRPLVKIPHKTKNMSSNCQSKWTPLIQHNTTFNE